MPRSVPKVASRARRKKMLKLAKGYWGRRKNVLTVAKNAVDKALGYAYVGRKDKKSQYRQIWIVRINAAVRPHGMNYSTFMHKLKEKNIDINRKVLADLAANNPAAFDAIVAQVK
ncbi:MAG: 50S ribosomal protein L20 [Chitinophagales bacterium]|jgi:large subunit ribosomal protein L20|nr:50S ribosomal protein L20 [Bacteroidota bacterium]MBP9878745.1 50S ribosomal protein L20 [Chitinophagales bacterium]MBK9506251.1 50S ribosomal protein L20 [Bacteroidota bacterium]MBK9555261.1 50S ribosomal protein L20 [Bacteroidota bacterium]MBL0279583.1 50S ribosomal protein L20 [Bacteroidota bacterium]